MSEEEREQKEQQWLLGNTAAYRTILMECARNLGEDDPLRRAAGLIAEREDAIAALRGLCDRYGLLDDWRDGESDDLHLVDIIRNLEKELADFLEEVEEE